MYQLLRFAGRVATVAGIAGLCLLVSEPAVARTPPLGKQRVLWLGDSITQAGDYVTFVQYELERMYPATRFDIVSIGLSSETVSCLSEKSHPFPRPCVQERLQRALKLVKPRIVVACYGMNDGIYAPQSAQRMAAFQQGIFKLSTLVYMARAKLILLTPPPFDALYAHNVAAAGGTDFGFDHPYRGYDGVLADYAGWEDSLHGSTASVVLDLHTSINVYLSQRRELSPAVGFALKDGIHPDLAGHLFMARVILRGLGVTPSAASLGDDLAAIQADRLYALVKRQREARSAGWLNYVGYTREKTVKTASVRDVERLNAALQAQIDRVRNAGQR